jgi:Fe-S-cluster containining protein
VIPLQNAEFRFPKNMRFRCSRCTRCCGDTETRIRHVLLLEQEVERISEITSKPVKAFSRRILGNEPYVYEMRKGKDTKCIFLDQETCAIYASRPLICRFYPFELKPEGNKNFVFSPTSECPSIGKGEVLEESYFNLLFRLAREFFA